MKIRHTQAWRAAVAVAASAALVAGCANAVSGSAQADPQASGQASGSPTSSAPTSSAPTSTAPTSTAPNSTAPGSTDSTATDSTVTGGSKSSSAPTLAGQAPSSASSDDAARYPTAPRVLKKYPTTDEMAAVLEGRRLAGYVVDPSQVVPTFTKGTSPTYPLKNGQALSLVLPDPVPTVATRAGLYAGFVGTRVSVNGASSMVVGVLEFPDAAKAAKAATEMAAAAKSDGDAKLAVPGYPAAVGWTAKSSRGFYAHAFLALGPLVLYGWTEGPAADKTKMPTIVATYFKMETAALKGFTPTAQAKLRTLPIDSQGVYARTLISPGNGDVSNGAYTPQAMTHFMTSYSDSKKQFAEAGVDVVAQSRSTVYRAQANYGAILLRDAYYQEIRTTDPKMEDYPVPDSAGAKCLQNPLTSSYYCTGAVGRYTFEFRSDSDQDVRRSLTSQISMLQG